MHVASNTEELRKALRRMIRQNDHKPNDEYRASDWFILAALTTALLDELDGGVPALSMESWFKPGDRVASLRTVRDGTVVPFPADYVAQPGTVAVHWDGRGPDTWSAAREVNLVKIGSSQR